MKVCYFICSLNYQAFFKSWKGKVAILSNLSKSRSKILKRNSAEYSKAALKTYNNVKR